MWHRLTMSPCAATVWLGRNERQMMIFCWHSLNISILWSGYKSPINRITLKQKKTYRTIYNIWWQIGHFEHFSPPETLQVQIQSQSGWSRFLVSILYSETAIVLHVQCTSAQCALRTTIQNCFLVVLVPQLILLYSTALISVSFALTSDSSFHQPCFALEVIQRPFAIGSFSLKSVLFHWSYFTTILCHWSHHQLMYIKYRTNEEKK